MTAKQRILEFVSGLPDELSEAQLEKYLSVHHKIQEGIRSAEVGPLIDHEDLPQLMEQWLENV